MAAVLQFRRKSAPVGWANDELAEFYRIVDVMGRAGLSISVDVGVSDEDEPWVAFVREDTGDVLAHIARIDGWLVAVSAASQEVVRAQTLKEVVRRIVDTHPLVLLPAHRPGPHIHIHPCAVLAAVITAAYLLAEGVQSEANAREFALSRVANEAAAEDARTDDARVHNVTADEARHADAQALDIPSLAAALAQAANGAAPSKVAPHPNPLRSALTSISDFLRGVGDIVQPVTLNTTSANAAIAAVVALAMTGEDSAANVAHLSAAEAQLAAAAIAAAVASGLTSADPADAKPGAASQHVVGLEAGGADVDGRADAARSGDHLIAVERVAIEVQAVARERAAPEPAPADPSTQLISQLMAKPLDGSVKVAIDASVQQHSAAAVTVEATPDHAVRPVATESISTAPSTVAGVAATSAAKSEYGTTGLSNLAVVRAAEATADHIAFSAHAADAAVLRLSDISKTALSALRISEAVITALSDATLTSATTRASENDALHSTVGIEAGKSGFSSTLADVTATAAASTKTFADSVTGDLSVVGDKSLTTVSPATYTAPAIVETAPATASTSSHVSASAGAAAASVSPQATALQSATQAAPTTQTDTVRPTSAYDIITGILSFAYGEHPIFAATSGARADITGDLMRYGVSPTTARVLIFSSETVTVPVFELTPGVVLVDGHEIAQQHRSANALNVSNATKVIYLPDGGTISLIGVVDLSIPV